MAQPWDYIAKIVSLGDSGCGKSSVRSIHLRRHAVVLTSNSLQFDSVKAASRLITT